VAESLADNCGPILLAEPEAEARKQLVRVFEHAGYTVVAVPGGVEALEVARETRPAAAILEVPLPRLSGYEVCRALREEFGAELPIVFVSGKRTESYDRVAGLLLGADDYLVKPCAPDELLTRVRRLLERDTPASPADVPRLTQREQEVLSLLAEGLEQNEIAERLVISTKTVGTHIEHILTKLGVRSRTQAVARAFREELIDIAR
jgi:two-component system, NarL family, nitrate/nitrite response regulator NarL